MLRELQEVHRVELGFTTPFALRVQGRLEEVQVRYARQLYGIDADRRPALAGKQDLSGAPLLPPVGELNPEKVRKAIRTILGQVGMSVDNIMRLTSYLRDASYAEANGAARVKALKGRVIPTTAIVVQTLSPDWLVEIEVIAAA